VEQDYDNLIITALDNQSNDDTYDILVDFERQYRDRLYTGRTCTRASHNEHRLSCMRLINPRSRLIQYLSATDVLNPTYVSRVVELFESNEQTGCVLTHADIIQPSGVIAPAPRHRSSDCILPGDIQMEAFMVLGFDLQVVQLYRIETYRLYLNEGLIFNRFPDWLPLVMASSISDFGYICDALAWRGDARTIHGDQFIPSLEDLFEHYLFLQAFSTIAARLGRKGVCAQLPHALRRLSRECIGCSSLLLHRGDFQRARSYLSLALAYLPEIADTQDFKQLAASFENRLLDGP
jgi:hypothetical protein